MLEKALQIDPADYTALSGTGYAYNALGQYEKVIQAEEQAIRIRPDDPYAWYYLGISYAREGRTDRAKGVYQMLRKIAPTMAEDFAHELGIP